MREHAGGVGCSGSRKAMVVKAGLGESRRETFAVAEVSQIFGWHQALSNQRTKQQQWSDRRDVGASHGDWRTNV
jgi:hypothetical protein